MTWLVAGGAGYIGAHVVRDLRASGRQVVVLDDLSTGSRDRIPADVPLVVGAIGDSAAVARALRTEAAGEAVTGVVNFAARKQVGESVSRPLFYWSENIGGLQALLAGMAEADVRNLVFSSSAAVYGQPDLAPGELISEGIAKNPINPYGATKLAGEWLAGATADALGWSAVSLRYFNVAGAGAPDLGDPAVLNLVPMVFRELATGGRPKVFGADYPTPDGTCIRDYIHVADLSAAHVAAVDRVEAGDLPGHVAVNIGTGQGSSVFEVLAAVTRATGLDATGEVVARRPGDPPILVAAPDRGRELLGWQSQFGLDDMVRSAWEAWQVRPGT
jgi:UDP-glucose 4-epimerase